ncbi:PKD domain-containing protein [Streptomyces albidoflavus]|uniref:PKD domain-containing protein n=1 Tax=Streptomyces albidoflavus TaxID=1886 RepID=UPI0010E29307|nr:PKD domain-containing protein [Streptomyces albidoflavus]RZF02847.1 hypothetical protein C0R05_32040 [Streptomyces albidoflavus]
MNNVFTLVSAAGETVLNSAPAKTEARVLEHGPTQVELVWETRHFEQEDANGLDAVLSAWPNNAELIVTKDDAFPLPEPEPAPEPEPEPEPAPEPEPEPEPAPEPEPEPEPAPEPEPEPAPEPGPLPQAEAPAALFRGSVTSIRIDAIEGTVALTALEYEDDEGDEDGDELVVTAMPGTEPRTLDVMVDNAGHGEVSVDFGDGSEQVYNSGDNVEVSSHVYGEPGTYTLTVTDTDEAERTSTVEVIVEDDGATDGADGSDEAGSDAPASRR